MCSPLLDIQKYKKVPGGCPHSLRKSPGDVSPNTDILLSAQSGEVWSLAKWRLWVRDAADLTSAGLELGQPFLPRLPSIRCFVCVPIIFMAWFVSLSKID